MSIATAIMMIPLVVRQKGTVLAGDTFPFASFKGDTSSRSGSDGGCSDGAGRGGVVLPRLGLSRSVVYPS
jgi:hypothetical protein